MTEGAAQTRSGFRIFRRESQALSDSGHMKTVGLDEAMLGNLSRLRDTQGPDASETRYLFGGNGMSLCSVWFRSFYPVVLHSHDADCLYYIVAGSIRLGTETLGTGDGFFVPADVPYTYTAGPEGVELLEFRTAEEFDIRFTSRNASYWEKTLATIADRRESWADEPRPVRRVQEEL